MTAYLFVYMNQFEQGTMYVLGVQQRGVVNNTQKGRLEELADGLAKLLPPDFKGEIPINWEVPAMMKRAKFSKVVPAELRPQFARALPDGITVNLE